jgi:DNA-binding MarR family transcriptional regulator
MLAANTPELLARECLAGRVRLLDNVITRIYEDALRPYGLDVDGVSVLVAVACNGGAINHDLCRFLHVEAVTLGRKIEELRERGWLELAPQEDGRTHRMRVSAEGLAQLQRIESAWREAQKKTEELLGAGAVAALKAMTTPLHPMRDGGRRQPSVPA